VNQVTKKERKKERKKKTRFENISNLTAWSLNEGAKKETPLKRSALQLVDGLRRVVSLQPYKVTAPKILQIFIKDKWSI